MLGTIFLNVVIFIGGACGVLSCLYMVLVADCCPVLQVFQTNPFWNFIV